MTINAPRVRTATIVLVFDDEHTETFDLDTTDGPITYAVDVINDVREATVAGEQFSRFELGERRKVTVNVSGRGPLAARQSWGW